MSTPYFAKGHGEVMGISFSGEVFMILENLWHLSQFLTTQAKSLLIVGQEYPARMAHPTLRMVSTNSFMDLLHHILRFGNYDMCVNNV
jgi:hypothetical protein